MTFSFPLTDSPTRGVLNYLAHVRADRSGGFR